MEDIQVKELVEVIARALAEFPEEVQVKEITGHQISVIELRAAKWTSERSSERKAVMPMHCAPSLMQQPQS